MAHEPARAMAGQARQRFQESEEDRITRSAGHFSEFEADMPKLANRFQFSFKDNLSSYLGRNNPFYSEANDDTDYVWLLDNTAYQNRLGRWKAEFVAAYFVRHSGKDLSEVVAWVSEKIGLADDEEAKKTIALRLEPFLDAILPAHAVNINLQGMKVRLGPSGRDGISIDELAIPGSNYKDGETVTSRAIGATATPLKTTFAKNKGWAVLSDIDDTIKKTLTSSPVGILKTTFAEDPEPINGMPELYKHIVQKLDNPPFWYLSASPYNLYPFLHQFRETYYPAGTMLLRDASWMNLAGFLANLTQGTEAYKLDRIEKVHEWFPKRKFILIGDSTQSDPEAYGEVYKKFPKWIGAIYIRKVTGVAEMDEGKKNSPERFEKAFKHVPKELWYVFQNPNELYAKVDALPPSIKPVPPATMRNTTMMEEHPYKDPDPVPIYILFTFAVLFCAYFAWLSSVAVRLYFYKGALAPEPEKFVILPAYLRDRSPQRGHQRRVTAFPMPAPPRSLARDLAHISRVTCMNIAVVDTEQLPDPEIRAFLAEQQRISRLPAFVQDDCGDGSDFPGIPFAITPVEAKQQTLTPPGLNRRPSAKYTSVGLKKVGLKEWLTIDKRYKDIHTARDYLLTKKNAECIQIKHDGENACEELLQEIVKLLVAKYPESFSIKTVNRRKHIHIPDVLPLTSSVDLLTRSTLYIQTYPDARPLAHLFFIQEPKDFFPGNLSSLLPQHIIVRREHQTFRRLPKSGAIIYSTRTEVNRLTELDVHGRRKLVEEIRSWNREVATRKGLELWQRAVIGYCEGKKAFRDDDTVIDGGE
ncbi:uncharacterized protein M421DRAFT_78116 [Didymella exigua CBS 183.55]|uniref:Phosphatidate phosphatase APP1 catalytic domain-containing protein n=1 Tax=Didymella exigua CBS 183.55 TaxID=1150837 RepID=A0A6A5R6Y1_9PLEO|nr:uncharacterized protein M421DRAFT_78116 [Didymella exigua CBS 183.55]KAF1922486.1 hypothetical protein M421DRAFT_78116 [Didymella exigua CBS 183.55]